MTSRSRSSAASSINYLGFNSDASCFSVGGEKGLSVFGSLPLKPLLVDEGLLEEREEAYDDDGDGDTPANSLRHSRTKIASAAASSMQRGLGCVALLERSNIVLLTTASTMRNPMFPPNRLLGWDDAHKRRIFEIEFSSDILNVKVCRTRFIVELNSKVLVYSLSNPPIFMHSFETVTMSTTSSTGQLVALSDLIPNTHTATTRISTTLHNGTSSFVVVLAIPGRREGQVQIVELAANHIPDQDGGNSPSSSNPPTPSTTLIQAHSSSLACLALSRNGHLLASASERGTIIRLFDARSGKLMAELRRGMDQAFIYSLAFDSSAERLCVASDKGTVHIFNLFEQQEQSQISSNQYSSYSSSSSSSTGNITAAAANIQQQLIQGGRQTLNFLSPYMPKYFNSQWSFAQFSMPSSSSDYKCVCAFYEPDEKKSSNGAGGDSFISSPSSSMDQLHATHHHRPIVIILCWDGTCSAISFDAKSGGECRRESFERFMPIGQGGVGAGEMGVNGYTSGSSLASTPKTRSSTSAKAPVSSISNTTDSSSLRSPSSMKQQQNQQPISKQQTASSSATTKSTSMTSSSTCHTSSSSTSPPLKAPPPFAKTVTTSPSRIAINPEDLLFEPPIVSSFSAKQHKQNHPPQPPPPPSSSSSSTQKLEDSQGSSGEFDIDTLNQEQLEQILKETKTGGEKKRNKGKGKAAADSHFGVDDDEDDWLS